VDSAGSGYGPVACYCESGDGYSSSGTTELVCIIIKWIFIIHNGNRNQMILFLPVDFLITVPVREFSSADTK
jgi:hypothetical protein